MVDGQLPFCSDKNFLNLTEGIYIYIHSVEPHQYWSCDNQKTKQATFVCLENLQVSGTSIGVNALKTFHLYIRKT